MKCNRLFFSSSMFKAALQLLSRSFIPFDFYDRLFAETRLFLQHPRAVPSIHADARCSEIKCNFNRFCIETMHIKCSLKPIISLRLNIVTSTSFMRPVYGRLEPYTTDPKDSIDAQKLKKKKKNVSHALFWKVDTNGSFKAKCCAQCTT